MLAHSKCPALQYFDPQPAIEFWDMTNRQDWEVCEQMQLGLQSKRFDRGLYAPLEDILFALDKEILKALGHDEPEKE